METIPNEETDVPRDFYDDYEYDRYTEARADAAAEAGYALARQEFLDYCAAHPQRTIPDACARLAWAIHAQTGPGHDYYDTSLRRADELYLSTALGADPEDSARRIMGLREGEYPDDEVVESIPEAYTEVFEGLRAFPESDREALRAEAGETLAVPGREDNDVRTEAVLDWLARYGEPVPAGIISQVPQGRGLRDQDQTAVLDRLRSLAPGDADARELLALTGVHEGLPAEAVSRIAGDYTERLARGEYHLDAARAAYRKVTGTRAPDHLTEALRHAHPAGRGTVHQSLGGAVFWRVAPDGTLLRKSGDGGWASTGSQAEVPSTARPVTRRMAQIVSARTGTCLGCSRPLSDPRSQERGYGPDCASLFC